MFFRKPVPTQPNVANIVTNGVVLFLASYAGIMGYKKGTKEFERLVPEAVQKITIAENVAASLRGVAEEEE